MSTDGTSADGKPLSLPVRNYLKTGVSLLGILVNRQAHPLYRVMYRVHMRNIASGGICLLGRKWTLRDTGGNTSIIEGDKVFNDMPVLKPGEVYCCCGYQEFTQAPRSMEVSFFGVDQSQTPFITPPLAFPRRCFASER